MSVRYDKLWPTTLPKFIENIVNFVRDPLFPKITLETVGTPPFNAVLYAGDSSWTAATLAGAYTNSGAPYHNASFRRLASGLVQIEGVVLFNGSALGSTIFTLPAGYRPGATILRAIIANGAFAELQITSAGVVSQVIGSVAAGAALGCEFYAEG